MKLFLALFFATTTLVAAQSPQVPEKLQFADITLIIRDDARKEIQKDVDAFTRYTNSFNVKAQRAKTYFPIIEKILAEENVPDDFKYLVIQESALIPDAVSTSNAVGFWQFKDFTAVEMGLRVDKEIDERLNIVSSTRAAARYLKKNYRFFNNWLYTLQSYQMGAGGVMRSEKDHKNGSDRMQITGSTYWYVKKYLAHKIAYEGAVRGEGQIKVLTYENNKSRRTLSDIASEVSADPGELRLYNKWTKSGKIPDDRNYVVLIPVKGSAQDVHVPVVAAASPTIGVAGASATSANTGKEIRKINGISVIRAGTGENITKLASRARVDLKDFLKWNDATVDQPVEPGQYFLLGKKRTRASGAAYHKVKEGETLWKISQQYGLRLNRLKKYNRIDRDDDVKPGMVLWLASMKPKGSNRVIPDAVEVDNETFAWSAEGSEANTPVDFVQVPPSESTLPFATTEAIVKDTVSFEPASSAYSSNATDTTAVNEVEGQSVQPKDSVVYTETRGSVTVVTDTLMLKEKQNVVQPEKSEHIVKAGETLYGISRQYNVGVMDLVNWNGLSLDQGIKPGQVLKLFDDQVLTVNAATPARSEQIVHEVKASDTVYSIARKYGVTIKELMEWNNKKDFNLSVGEKLTIMSR